MTQPKYAPILEHSEVRDVRKLPPPLPWRTHRPGEPAARPLGVRAAGRGVAGPDQGYALLLAERYGERLRLAEGEHADDVLHGAVVIGLCRAALFGRAPVSHDIELALHLFGYLEGASDEIIEARSPWFRGLAHDYWRQRELADLVPETTLRLTPRAVADQIAENPGSFQELAGLAA